MPSLAQFYSNGTGRDSRFSKNRARGPLTEGRAFPSRLRREATEDQADGRGLARAVGHEESHDHPGAHAENARKTGENESIKAGMIAYWPSFPNTSGERRGAAQGVERVPMDGGEILTFIVFGVVVVCILAFSAESCI